MKRFMVCNVILLLLYTFFVPTCIDAMFCCSKHRKRSSVFFNPLPPAPGEYASDECKVKERQPEPKKEQPKTTVLPTRLFALLEKRLPASFSKELLGLIMAYRIPELIEGASFRINDIEMHVTERPNNRLAVELSDGKTEIRDMTTGECLQTDKNEVKTSDLTDLSLNIPRLLATIDLANGGRASILDNGSIQIYDQNFSLKNIIDARHAFRDGVNDKYISVLSDGGFVIAIPVKFDDYKIERWQPGSKALEKIIDIKEPVYALTEYTENFIAVSVSFKPTKLFDIRTGKCVGTLPGDPKHEIELFKLSAGRLLSSITHVGYDRGYTEFKVWE